MTLTFKLLWGCWIRSWADVQHYEQLAKQNKTVCNLKGLQLHLHLGLLSFSDKSMEAHSHHLQYSQSWSHTAQHMYIYIYSFDIELGEALGHPESRHMVSCTGRAWRALSHLQVFVCLCCHVHFFCEKIYVFFCFSNWGFWVCLVGGYIFFFMYKRGVYNWGGTYVTDS